MPARPTRQQRPHHGRHRHAAAVITKARQQTRRNLLQTWQAISGDSHEPAPVILIRDAVEFRKDFAHSAIMMARLYRQGSVAEHTTRAHTQSARRIETEVTQQM